jgi:hypothetical protein
MRWMLTILATAASAYVLDAVATACGLILVATGWLVGIDVVPLLAFLALTYVFWAIGLSANLRANWRLLEATGTSTNAVSKAAYDVVGRFTTRLRIRQIAAAAGYVSTEIAKEVPYYAGAFGAAALTDAITTAEALTFLGGANLGAAGYEFGLARLTEVGLRRRQTGPGILASGTALGR